MKKNKKDGLTLKRLIKIAEHDFDNRDFAIVYINGKFYEDYTHMQCITQFLKENDITILQTDFIHRPQNDQFLELSKEYGQIVLAHMVKAENAVYIIVGYDSGEMFSFDLMDQFIIEDRKEKKQNYKPKPMLGIDENWNGMNVDSVLKDKIKAKENEINQLIKKIQNKYDEIDDKYKETAKKYYNVLKKCREDLKLIGDTRSKNNEEFYEGWLIK